MFRCSDQPSSCQAGVRRRPGLPQNEAKTSTAASTRRQMEIPASQAGFTAASCWEQRVTRDERQLILWFTNNATRMTRDSRQRLMCCHLDNDKGKQKKRTKRKLPQRDEKKGTENQFRPLPDSLAIWPPFARLLPPPPPPVGSDIPKKSACHFRKSARLLRNGCPDGEFR